MQFGKNIIISILSCHFSLLLLLIFITNYYLVLSNYIDNHDGLSENIIETVNRNNILKQNQDKIHYINQQYNNNFNNSPDDFNVKDYCFIKNVSIGEPIQLVSPSKNHFGFELNEDALDIISKLSKPIAVVGVLGSINVGKSFFLNVLNEHLLCGDASSLYGFDVSDSPYPKTQGIWAWSIPLEIDYNNFQNVLNKLKVDGLDGNDLHIVSEVVTILNKTMNNRISKETSINPDNPPVKHVNLLLLDVEGFNSPYSTRSYDEALFSIVATLSSEIIYLTNRTIDGRCLVDLQSLTRSFNLFNIKLYSYYLKLFNDFEPSDDEDSVFSDYEKPDEFEYVDVDKGDVEMLMEMMKNKSLTIVVQNYLHDLNMNSLSWLHSLLTSFRYDLTIEDVRNYLDENDDRIKIIIQKLLDEKNHVDRQVDDSAWDDIKKSANDYTWKLSSQYKYNIQHMFNSIDCILLPCPTDVYNLKNLNRINKRSLNKNFLIQLTRLKAKLFSRAFRLPRHKLIIGNSYDSRKYTLMNGADLIDVLRFIVYAWNNNLSEDIPEYIKEFKLTRVSFYKNDLCDIYKTELLNFISTSTLPLHSDLFEFNKTIIKRVDDLFTEYIYSDASNDDYLRLRGEMSTVFNKTFTEVSKMLTVRLSDYCLSHITSLKDEIEDDYRKLMLPMIPEKLLEVSHIKKKVFFTRCIKSINIGGVLYSESEACISPLKDFGDYIDGLFNDIQDKNRKLLEGKFEYAYDLCIEWFKKNFDISNDVVYHVPLKEFENVLNEKMNETLIMFDNILDEFKSIEYFHHMYTNKLKKSLIESKRIILHQWSNICINVANDIIERHGFVFNDRVLEYINYPTIPFIIRLITLYLKLDILCELQSLYCSNDKIFNTIIKIFNKRMIELIDDAYSNNYESILNYYKNDLISIHDNLIDIVDDYYLWYTFSRRAYNLVYQIIFTLHVDDVDDIFIKPINYYNDLRNKLNIEMLKDINIKLLSRIDFNDYKLLNDFIKGDLDMNTCNDINHFKNDIIIYWINTRLAPEFKLMYYNKLKYFIKIIVGLIIIFISTFGFITCHHINYRIFFSFTSALGCSLLIGFKTMNKTITLTLYTILLIIYSFINYIFKILGPKYTFIIGFITSTLLSFIIYKVYKKLKNQRIFIIQEK